MTKEISRNVIQAAENIKGHKNRVFFHQMDQRVMDERVTGFTLGQGVSLHHCVVALVPVPDLNPFILASQSCFGNSSSHPSTDTTRGRSPLGPVQPSSEFYPVLNKRQRVHEGVPSSAEPWVSHGGWLGMSAGLHRDKRDFQRSNKLEKCLRCSAGGGAAAAAVQVGLCCAS